ncbi:hypothetical protein WAF17_21060 [Bernardetia sp. ABR2-2B]|uniref:hypothetical protein n=1 Tax=Bernardetia sp. ABR2-2B TaxID=3127472 RepID=UPI0030D2EA64
MKKIILTKIISLLEFFKAKLEQPKRSKKVSVLRTDKNGNTWYAYKMQDLPDARAVYMQAILNQMAVGIDNEQLQKLLSNASETVHALGSSNINDVKNSLIYQFENIKERSENIVNIPLLEQAALTMLVLDGEPDDIQQEWQTKKRKLLAQDEDSKVFFYAFVLNIIRDSANISPQELKNYLRAKAVNTI